MKIQVLRNLKSLFQPDSISDLPLDALDDLSATHLVEASEAEALGEGIGGESAERLRMSFSRRLIFDYGHLIPPFGADIPEGDRIREQVREALRTAIGEKRSAEDAIQGFAEVLILCGLSEGSHGDPPVMNPLEAVETSEKYYKRITLWKKAIKDGAPESERIKLSKDVYASEHEIFGCLDRLRHLYVRSARGEAAAPGGDGNGAEAEGDGTAMGAGASGDGHGNGNGNGMNGEGRLPEPGALFGSRIRAFHQLRDQHAIEEAYITYKEKTPPPPPPPPERYHEEPRRSGGLEIENLVQLFQAMSLLQGGARPQVLDGAEKKDEEKKTVIRQFKNDGDFGVKDKERLLKLLSHCEAGKMKFDKDYETLEAMVYRKPHQVVLTLATKVDDPVFYK